MGKMLCHTTLREKIILYNIVFIYNNYNLLGATEYHVNNSMEFTEEIKKMKLEEGECLTSYDVSALFTSIPISSALDIINNKLQDDTDFHNRTKM